VLSGEDQIGLDSIPTWLPHQLAKDASRGRDPAGARAPSASRASRQSAAWLRAMLVAPLLATVPAFALLAALTAAP